MTWSFDFMSCPVVQYYARNWLNKFWLLMGFEILRGCRLKSSLFSLTVEAWKGNVRRKEETNCDSNKTVIFFRILDNVR